MGGRDPGVGGGAVMSEGLIKITLRTDILNSESGFFRKFKKKRFTAKSRRTRGKQDLNRIQTRKNNFVVWLPSRPSFMAAFSQEKATTSRFNGVALFVFNTYQ
jgi:hypothetical protein